MQIIKGLYCVSSHFGKGILAECIVDACRGSAQGLLQLCILWRARGKAHHLFIAWNALLHEHLLHPMQLGLALKDR